MLGCWCVDILPHLKARDSYGARKAALDHLSSRFGGFLLLAISSIAHFTGATGVSRPENVDRADPVGVFLETTRDAGEPFLCLLWSPSYFASSCAEAPISIVRQHIEQQKTPN